MRPVSVGRRFFVVDLQASPTIPASERGVRSPRLSDLFTCGPVWLFVKTIQGFDGVADSQVAMGEDIQSSQTEDQKHMCRPVSDSFDLGQLFDDLLISFGMHPAGLDSAVQKMLLEVAEVA